MEDFNPKRVVVVDDETLMLRTHGRVLRAGGLEPVLIGDPLAALPRLLENRDAAVVVDLVMPRMTGLELASHLHQELGERAPPIVLVSALATELTTAERCAFCAIHKKPYSVDAFVRDVRTWVRRQAERRLSSSGLQVRVGPSPSTERKRQRT